MTSWHKRVVKEMKKLREDNTSGLKIVEENLPERLVIEISSDEESIYKGQKYKLEVKFDKSYPFSAPLVKFLPPDIPIHPHVFSNGQLCLSLLYDDWTPSSSVWSICISIISMINTNTKFERPLNDAYYSAGKDLRTMLKNHPFGSIC